ncbi:hypothetical protein [Endozoicomonas sp. 4G]|uniref:hypothetical protein n=1 Tax=Endozoicomonas sp. 4G TaxID=2872754 RepID=UPI002078B42D|nr:hypothetical protein [Endozoicomonas sp. 4G]
MKIDGLEVYLHWRSKNSATIFTAIHCPIKIIQLSHGAHSFEGTDVFVTGLLELCSGFNGRTAGSALLRSLAAGFSSSSD